jgi:hypothetical protein
LAESTPRRKENTSAVTFGDGIRSRNCASCAAPEITAECEHWHSNDGDGLDATGAVRLVERLQQLLVDGSVAAYVKRRDAALAQLPDETCGCCDGTGTKR